MTSSDNERKIRIGKNLPRIPEPLLSAHERGEVLFVAGAGISRPSLPDFPGLVKNVYKKLDPVVHKVIDSLSPKACYKCLDLSSSNLEPKQLAEINSFINKNYDVTLGMLERRIDGVSKNSYISIKNR